MITRIPQLITDLSLYWGQDLSFDDSGDLLLTNLATLSEQRVLRRLLTSPGTNIWSPTYGAGVPSFVGQPLSQDNFDAIKSLILSQILLEDTVAADPAPQIFINVIQGGLFCQIQYSLNPTLQPIVLNYNLSM